MRIQVILFQRFLLEILIRLKVLSFLILLTKQSAHSCRNINQNYRILLKCWYNWKVYLKVDQKCPMQLEISLEQSLSLYIKDWDQSIGISRNIAHSSWQAWLVTMTLLVEIFSGSLFSITIFTTLLFGCASIFFFSNNILNILNIAYLISKDGYHLF